MSATEELEELHMFRHLLESHGLDPSEMLTVRLDQGVAWNFKYNIGKAAEWGAATWFEEYCAAQGYNVDWPVLGLADGVGGGWFGSFTIHDGRIPAWRRVGLARVTRCEELPIYTFRASTEAEHVFAACRSRERLEAFLVDMERAYREKARARRFVRGYGTPDYELQGKASWEDLLLPDPLKSEIRRQVHAFTSSADLFRRLGVPHRRGLLFAGPPGNGKTLLCRTIVATAALPAYQFMFRKETEDELEDMLEEAKGKAPCILIFEDLDHLTRSKVTLSEFLNFMDGVDGREGLLILGTANRVEKLDPALTRRPSRFDRVWSIPNPPTEIRREYLSRLLRSDEGPVLDWLVEKTTGFSVAMLKETVITARLFEIQSDGSPGVPGGSDPAARFLRAMESLKPAASNGATN